MIASPPHANRLAGIFVLAVEAKAPDAIMPRFQPAPQYRRGSSMGKGDGRDRCPPSRIGAAALCQGQRALHPREFSKEH